MTAETYRPYAGRLRSLRLRFWPLLVVAVRAGCRKKIALIAIYTIPAIWTVIFSFNVYARFALEEGNVLGHAPPGFAGRLAAGMAAKLFETRGQLAELFKFTRMFGLLAAAWYGAGLLIDDRRNGTHLLLFSRPITRLDYLVARFLTVFFFSGLCTIAPGLVICTTAAFSSPDWAFVTEDGGVIVGTLAYGILVAAFYSLIVLVASSVATRKVFALAATFGVMLIPHGVGTAMWRFSEDTEWRLLSPFVDLARVGYEAIDRPDAWYGWPVEHSIAVLGGVMVVAAAVVAWRVRRLEVVA